MRINRQIRVPKVRLIDEQGNQLGVVSIREAQQKAEDAGLDLVEIAPNAEPPVCKIIDFGKFRYDQTKREKESKKAQHQIKVKEVKLKPNIDSHDLEIKINQAKKFLGQGNKVKVTMMFRGREMVHSEIGEKVVEDFYKALDDDGAIESPPKRFGRTITLVIAPSTKKKKPDNAGATNMKAQENKSAANGNAQENKNAPSKTLDNNSVTDSTAPKNNSAKK